jgi:hypothetical protein
MPFLIIIGVLIIAIRVVIAINDRRFKRMASSEIAALFGSSEKAPAMAFSEAQLAGLPEPVQTYLRRSLHEGQPYITCARLKQSGFMRLAPDQPWRPFQAEQYFTVNRPAFLWLAKMRVMPLIWVTGRDLYARQQGNMLIRILSTITVVNAVGPKIATGAFVRYIAECGWFPTAFVRNSILRWEAVDARTARAIARDGDVEAIVTFHFDPNGDITKVSSESRYREVDDPQPTHWHADLSHYREFSGVRLPAQVEVVWDLETGSFPYWRGTIVDIEFNVPAQY